MGRDVAAAVLASYSRPFSTVAGLSDDAAPTLASGDSPDGLKGESEVSGVLAHEEREWWKTVHEPRKPHEESVWIEPVVLDERVVGRMRVWERSAEDEARARRLGDGREKVVKVEEREG